MTSNNNSPKSITIFVCPPTCLPSEIPGLAALLKEVVDENIPLNFCQPFSLKDAEAWWGDLQKGVDAGTEIVILAHKHADDLDQHEKQSGESENTWSGRRLVGCVILYLAQKTNAFHRGEIGKLLVTKEERGSGVGKRLMDCLEDQARKHGRTILVLDTETGSPAEKFYDRTGWIKVGDLPDVVYLPDKSALSSCTFYYKRISRPI
ncbi:hypothetical protein D9758_006217 [Tetrapyrgos nigripes]|uniref:N-acetyltransferase domain-containing protein n=1 Tax=Tetrapyrgos nigripes TaxID=182062 RepID=A0A8H5GAT4_9AGAR|nr:hypothetical protein D9758_006217 [Tetrapyrgos nigripes]